LIQRSIANDEQQLSLITCFIIVYFVLISSSKRTHILQTSPRISPHSLDVATMALFLSPPTVAVGSAIALLVAYAVHKHSKQVYEDVEELKEAAIPDETLFPLFQPHLVPMAEIRKRGGHSAVLSLVQNIIGLIPTCDMVLEIWPPAFECYNLTVPNLLNFPHLLLGMGARKDLVAIAAYVSSRATGCAYCSSHTCSFAARRGVDPQVLSGILEDVGKESPKEDESAAQRQAVVKVSYGLGTVPATLTKEAVEEMERVLSGSDAEWIVAVSATFGSFNKLMDGLGIPLERNSYAETIDILDAKYSLGKAGSMLDATTTKAPPPPTDDWTLKVACIYHCVRPGGGLALDQKLHEDTPKTSQDCMGYLQRKTGHSFPVLEQLQHSRVYRAITAILKKNFDETLSAGLSIPRKVRLGIQFANFLENTYLKEELQVIGTKLGAPGGRTNDDEIPLDEELLLRLTKALSYTPNRVSPKLVQDLRDHASVLTAPMLVELVSFLAPLQMLHRIEMYYLVKGSLK
jgi:hypothetical protein